MKLKHAEYFNELSPNDIIDTMELEFNEEEKRIFSDAVLLAQQYYKYTKDFVTGKREKITNKDNITWYKRFIYDALLRPDLIAKINNSTLSTVENIINQMTKINLIFVEDCLEIDNLYEKTITEISNNPIKSFYDIKLFISECTEAKKRHIIEKIDIVPENLSNYIMF